MVSGGETCGYSPPRSDCPSAISNMTNFHWSYLNLDYHPTVLDKWRTQGCFTEIKQKLGYRFTLKNGSFSKQVKPGGNLSLNLEIENQGWAAPFNKRNVELILRNNNTKKIYHIQLDEDLRH